MLIIRQHRRTSNTENKDMLDSSLTLVAVFLSVALVTGSLAAFGARPDAPGRRRLRQFAGNGRRRCSSSRRESVSRRRPAGDAAVAAVVPKSPKDMSRLRRRLAQAGYYSHAPPSSTRLPKFVLPVDPRRSGVRLTRLP